MKRVLISGATGLIGSAVLARLRASGYEAHRFVRDRIRESGDVAWNPRKPLDATALEDRDAIVHLAGKTVAGRWNDAVKREIRESRVQGTRVLAEAAAESFRKKGKPTVLVSASAIGYYGSRGDEELDEQSRRGNGFLAEVSEEWEAATGPARAAGVRVANARIGLVLSTRGGALVKMLPLFKLGVAGRIGSGRQWWSWVTLDDVVSAILFAVEQPISGAFNATAPEPVTNAEFTQTLARALHRPALFPLPAFAARLAFGAAADELMLSSQRVIPQKLLAAGFRFQQPSLMQALAHVLSDR